MTINANRIERYYDTHPVEGDELTQSLPHFAVIQYLVIVLQWLFHGKQVGVVSNVNFYQTEKPTETAISPDIAVVDGLVVRLPELGQMPSYYIGKDGPPPRVVLEIASKETWKQDLEDKPSKYYAMGVSEYFVYDPTDHPVWTKQWRGYNRLIGWRRDPALGQYVLLTKDAVGRLWSAELESWLAVEPEGLKLYTVEGLLRLTEAEAYLQRAEEQQRRAEMQERWANVQEQRANVQEQRANVQEQRASVQEQRASVQEQRASVQEQRASVQEQRASVQEQRASVQEQRAEKLAEMLRKLGHNPDELI